MKSISTRSLALVGVVALLCAMPSSQLQSQTAIAPEVFDALQQIAVRNQEIIQKQEEMLRNLDEILNDARQAKIFSKRG
jgi:hypothetical protein